MNKKRITFNLSIETIDSLKRISKETMIPQTRLVEKALNALIDNFNKKHCN